MLPRPFLIAIRSKKAILAVLLPMIAPPSAQSNSIGIKALLNFWDSHFELSFPLDSSFEDTSSEIAMSYVSFAWVLRFPKDASSRIIALFGVSRIGVTFDEELLIFAALSTWAGTLRLMPPFILCFICTLKVDICLREMFLFSCSLSLILGLVRVLFFLLLF